MPLAIATEAGCALLILIGYQARAAALLLAGFCIVTAVLFHSKLGNRNELLHFEKALRSRAVARSFARGAGHWAVDALWPVWRASQNPAATAKVPSLPQS